jgi:hypothetical protein
MKDIKQFNRANIKGLRNEIDEALDRVAKKYGITISAGNCTFSGNEANFKLKLNTIGEGGTVITRESQMWDLYKSRTQCSHLNVGDTITIQGTPESFLQLFIDREEYEVCAKLVDKVPELRHY